MSEQQENKTPPANLPTYKATEVQRLKANELNARKHELTRKTGMAMKALIEEHRAVAAGIHKETVELWEEILKDHPDIQDKGYGLNDQTGEITPIVNTDVEDPLIRALNKMRAEQGRNPYPTGPGEQHNHEDGQPCPGCGKVHEPVQPSHYEESGEVESMDNLPDIDDKEAEASQAEEKGQPVIPHEPPASPPKEPRKEFHKTEPTVQSTKEKMQEFLKSIGHKVEDTNPKTPPTTPPPASEEPPTSPAGA